VDDDVLGPIDYLAVEWPGGQVTGEGFQLLLDLVDRGIIRVLAEADPFRRARRPATAPVGPYWSSPRQYTAFTQMVHTASRARWSSNGMSFSPPCPSQM